VLVAAASVSRKPIGSRSLTKTGVAVEKVLFSQNSRILGDRKCLPKRRSSFVELPIAKFFRPFSGE
jgi:hypothetical protein